MKTSVNWLKQYVDLSWSTDELARRLTGAGLEVEGILRPKPIPAGVIVAEILAREPHPNADKLSVCRVSTGSGDPLQVVCGAPNCDAGQKVALATVGTDLGDGKLKKAKLRGIESFGMLCSTRALGLNEDHNGIMILPPAAALGKPLAEFLGSDTVIDWEVTPNRPDWLSHIGIAREIAAISDGKNSFRLPEVTLTPVTDTKATDVAAVEVQAPDLCPRYIARVLRNVKIGPSPAWMCRFLESVGLRPINNVVDITNFVMLECGQPLHAFDLEQLAGQKIIVRRANPGETITTLDARTHQLTPDNLLIADAEKGVALAGVMGGANSMIADTTSNVLLESAVFLPRNIRATARKLGIGTDSSHRFERGVSFEMADFASRRAAALICECAGGELLEGVIDVRAPQPPPARISCRVARVNQLLGIDLTGSQIAAYFDRLGLPIVSATDSDVTVDAPHFRLDLAAEVDLIEEVARVHGLDNIPEAPAGALVGGLMSDDKFYPLEEARAQLLGLGLDEIMNYTLLPLATALAGTGVREDELVMLANPISTEGVCLRPSLLPSLLQSVANNIAHNNPDLALFELGRVMVRNPQLPEERWQAGIALTGRPHPERFGAEREAVNDFYDLKGILEGWFAARRLTGLVYEPAAHPALLPGTTAVVRAGDAVLGIFGEVVPTLTRDMRLKHPLFIALVELEALIKLTVGVPLYKALPQFPATARDVAMIAPEGVTCGEITRVIQTTKCPWLENVELFDVFADEKVLGPGKKSLAFSLTYRRSDRTLTDEEANQAHEAIKAELAKQLPVLFR